MGKYIHRYKTLQEFEKSRDGFTETTEATAIYDGYGTYYFDGLNNETGRYVWRDSADTGYFFETYEEHPNLSNSLVVYDFYNGEWESWTYEAGTCSYTTAQVQKKHKTEYKQPWLSFTEGRGVDYNHKFEYVDFGLPSGTLWAKCNVGAFNPEDYGGYYAWGELEEKERYTWDNYSLGGNADRPNKYNDSDNLSVLEAVDDVANAFMGQNWRIPSDDDFYELLNGTNKEWTQINGINGVKFTSKTDQSKYIFIPAGGFYDSSIGSGGIGGLGEVCSMWTNGMKSYPWMATCFMHSYEWSEEENVNRSNGNNVRAIMKPNN